MNKEIYNYKNGLALHQWRNKKWSIVYEKDSMIEKISWSIASELIYKKENLIKLLINILILENIVFTYLKLKNWLN